MADEQSALCVIDKAQTLRSDRNISILLLLFRQSITCWLDGTSLQALRNLKTKYAIDSQFLRATDIC